ncbi:MAG: hypothetical protein D6791_11410 [Chloroflexi bacterium]|nr:MAG: hypothetical protein D6791_11410 [Chloroflexota bacterium]
MGGKLDPALKKRLEAEPTQRLDVIVRTVDDPRTRAAQVIAHGLSIRHTYSLIKALAATGLGVSILQLADEPWVEKIEPDEEVRTMD